MFDDKWSTVVSPYEILWQFSMHKMFGVQCTDLLPFVFHSIFFRLILCVIRYAGISHQCIYYMAFPCQFRCALTRSRWNSWYVIVHENLLGISFPLRMKNCAQTCRFSTAVSIEERKRNEIKSSVVQDLHSTCLNGWMSLLIKYQCTLTHADKE